MGTAHPTGFPTYVLLGWLASVVLQPFGEPAFRMNLFSALCVAVAAGVTVDLVRALTGSLVARRSPPGLGLALTPTAWAIATHAEAHSLHLALVAILLWLLVAWESRVAPGVPGRRRDGGDHAGGERRHPGDRFLVAAAVVFGLAMGNHSLTLLLALPVGLFVIAVDPFIWRRRRLVLGCIGALAVTLVVVYAELPLRAGIFRAPLVYGRPDTWDGFWYVTLGEQFRGSLEDPFGELPRQVRRARRSDRDAVRGPRAVDPPWLHRHGRAAAGVRAHDRLGGLHHLLLRGLVRERRHRPVLPRSDPDRVDVAGDPRRRQPSTSWRSRPANRSRRRTGRPRSGRARVRPIPVWSGLAAVGLAVILLAPTVIALPDRFAFVDERSNVEAQGFVDHVTQTLAPGAMLVSWWSYSTPLWYAQLIDGRRPDLAIVDDRTRLDQNLGDITDVIDANLGKRPVYVIRNDSDEIAMLAARYDLEYIDGFDASMLTRVIGRKAGS